LNIAVIPARGGSKRIPRKNIKLFCGKPMIAWSIQAAIESKCFDRIIVSTDDQEIAEIAKSYGAESPFIRPAELSNDHTGTIPVIVHAIKQIQENYKINIKNVCSIHATAPFVMSEDLKQGLNILLSTDASYAISVTSFPFPIQRAIKITRKNRLQMFQPEHFNTRSQDLEEALHDAGQFYWGKANAWISQKQVFTEETVPIQLPRYRVQDIDTQEDWIRAEWMFQSWKSTS